MTEFPDTRESVLVQVRSPENREAWEQFVQIYRPVIYRLARQRGLQDADAQDLAQTVLIAVASSIGKWQKNDESVRFRHWLRRVARNAIINALSRQPFDRAAGGTSAHELLSEEADASLPADADIENAYRRELYLQASRIVRNDFDSETWRAFEITVVENRSIEDATHELNKSVGAIYASRSRIMRKLRETVRDLERRE